MLSKPDRQVWSYAVELPNELPSLLLTLWPDTSSEEWHVHLVNYPSSESLENIDLWAVARALSQIYPTGGDDGARGLVEPQAATWAPLFSLLVTASDPLVSTTETLHVINSTATDVHVDVAVDVESVSNIGSLAAQIYEAQNEWQDAKQALHCILQLKTSWLAHLELLKGRLEVFQWMQAIVPNEMRQEDVFRLLSSTIDSVEEELAIIEALKHVDPASRVAKQQVDAIKGKVSTLAERMRRMCENLKLATSDSD